MEESRRWPRYAEVLARWIDESGLSLREIEDRCKAAGQPVTYSYISKLRAGNVDPPSSAITRTIAKVLGKPPAFLELVQGLERMEEPFREVFWIIISRHLDPNKPMEQQLSSGGSVLEALGAGEAAVDPTPKRRVPLFKKEPPPPGVPVERLREFAPNQITMPEEELNGADYVLVVTGNAMSDFGFWSGDYLSVVHGTDELTQGCTVLVRIGDQVTARRYYEIPDSFRLEPALFGGTPIDLGEVQILGVIRKMVRPM